MLKNASIRLIFIIICGLSGCNKPEGPSPMLFIESTFSNGMDEWSGDVAYYKEGQIDSLKFEVKNKPLPSEVISTRFTDGLFVSANNPNDSIFLFIKRKISNLDPTKTYKVAFEINLVTELPDTLGSAGRISYVKAGASTTEPIKVLKNQLYHTSIVHGNSNTSGKEMLALGNLGNKLDSTAFKSIVRSNPNLAIDVKPSTTGEIWLCIAISSRHKGNIPIYIERIFAAIGIKSEEPIN